MASSPAPPARAVLPAPGASSPPGARDADTPSLSLLAFECSLDTARLDELEAVSWAIAPATVRGWFERFPATREAALLSTCHRVELYVLAPTPDEGERWREVLPGPREAWRTRVDWDAGHHLFRVAAGCESSAAGEAEVRHQVQAAGRKVLSRHARPVLRDLFGGAVDAARELADPRAPLPSIASVAVDRLRELTVRPHPRVLVVGTGTVGRQLARGLASFARTTLLFHERPPEPSFLNATGAEAIRLDRLTEALRSADAVVTAAKFGDRGLRARDLPRDRPLVLVDLGMPRNIDPSVRDLPDVRLVDLEELYARSRGPARSVPSELRTADLADRFYDRWARHLSAPSVDALLRAAEATRRSELAVARRFLRTLDADQEKAVDRLTRRLVARLVLPPVERIRALPTGPKGERQRRLALELLRPADPAP